MGRIRRALCLADAMAIEPVDRGPVRAGLRAAAKGAHGGSLRALAGGAHQTVGAAFPGFSDGAGVVAAAIAASAADNRDQGIRCDVQFGADSGPSSFARFA